MQILPYFIIINNIYYFIFILIGLIFFIFLIKLNLLIFFFLIINILMDIIK